MVETDSAATAGADDPAAAMRRLRWRARRGLLENDLLLTRFLDREGEALSREERDALAQLLEAPDTELFDLLLGRSAPQAALDTPAVCRLLERMRSEPAR